MMMMTASHVRYIHLMGFLLSSLCSLELRNLGWVEIQKSIEEIYIFQSKSAHASLSRLTFHQIVAK